MNEHQLYNNPISTSWAGTKLHLERGKTKETTETSSYFKTKSVHLWHIESLNPRRSKSVYPVKLVTRTYMNSNCNGQNGENTEENNGMNQNRNPTCAHVSELHHPCSCRELKQQPWGQKYEECDWHHHWPPIDHHFLTDVFLFVSPLSSLSMRQSILVDVSCLLRERRTFREFVAQMRGVFLGEEGEREAC